MTAPLALPPPKMRRFFLSAPPVSRWRQPAHFLQSRPASRASALQQRMLRNGYSYFFKFQTAFHCGVIILAASEIKYTFPSEIIYAEIKDCFIQPETLLRFLGSCTISSQYIFLLSSLIAPLATARSMAKRASKRFWQLYALVLATATSDRHWY